jgi:glycosyltransferase involved in cell wall biosynthesis
VEPTIMRACEWPADRDGSDDRLVGVVMVSFNTMQITAQAIYALFRHLKQAEFRLLVVDNASTDGSAQMLAALADAGLCEVILNTRQRYHGPALNQALDHLAAAQVASTLTPVRYVWVLDSDCIVIDRDTLGAAVHLMATTGAGLVGQSVFDDWHHGDMMGLHSLLLDPRQVWRDPIMPFAEHGSPSQDLQRSANRYGIRAAEFPFTRGGYVIHLGRATLRAIAARGERDNRYFDWASTHHEPHFMGDPDAPARYAAYVRAFTAEVGDPSPDNLIAACRHNGHQGRRGP